MPLSPEESTRNGFSLTGPSVLLDPRTHAVRADLADIRLADRVFAPHYAAPVEQVVTKPASMRIAREDGAEILVGLQPGDRFELLDVVGGDGWGIAVASGLVGYVDAAVLEKA